MFDIVNNQGLTMLIVDDESLMRRGLRMCYNWDEYGISKVIEAEGSIQAIEISKTEKPDIIITDIRMPDFDGLELIERLKTVIPDSTFIIISGYDDFSYAKQAIALGVFHYLVKPINSVELCDTIKRCVANIKLSRKRIITMDELVKKIDEYLPTIKDNLIRNILSGNIVNTDEELQQKLVSHNIDILNEYYAAIIIKPFILDNNSYAKINMINVLVKEELHEYLQQSFDCVIKHYAMVDMYDVKIIISYTNYKGIREYLTQHFVPLAADIKKMFDVDLIFTVGSTVESIDKLQVSHREALLALDYKMLANEYGALFIDDVPTLRCDCFFPVIASDQRNLVLSIERNSISDISRIVDEIKNTVKKIGYVNRSYLYAILLELLVSTVRSFNERGISMGEIYDSKIFSYEFIAGFNSIDEAFLWLREFFCSMSDFVTGFCVSSSERIIHSIKEYIIDNINSDISLNKISEKFYYSSSYLSRLFKDIMNVNFSNYVNDLRISLSKDLLLNTNLKVNKICEKVGYKNYKYFVSLFKKNTGTTPVNYRLINKKCV